MAGHMSKTLLFFSLQALLVMLTAPASLFSRTLPSAQLSPAVVSFLVLKRDLTLWGVYRQARPRCRRSAGIYA